MVWCISSYLFPTSLLHLCHFPSLLFSSSLSFLDSLEGDSRWFIVSGAYGLVQMFGAYMSGASPRISSPFSTRRASLPSRRLSRMSAIHRTSFRVSPMSSVRAVRRAVARLSSGATSRVPSARSSSSPIRVWTVSLVPCFFLLFSPPKTPQPSHSHRSILELQARSPPPAADTASALNAFQRRCRSVCARKE